MERNCIECGDTLVGRSDKKFCCDTCRNAFNNALNRDSKNVMRTTNNHLRKNYRILEQLNPKGKTKVAKATLLHYGFSFDHITRITTSETGGFCLHVYDQCYAYLENGTCLLVKKVGLEK